MTDDKTAVSLMSAQASPSRLARNRKPDEKQSSKGSFKGRVGAGELTGV